MRRPSLLFLLCRFLWFFFRRKVREKTENHTKKNAQATKKKAAPGVIHVESDIPSPHSDTNQDFKKKIAIRIFFMFSPSWSDRYW